MESNKSVLNKEPRVSIIIANHNYSEWVCKCIYSAINQLYENYEIIVADGASTDDSVSKIYNEFFKPNPHSNHDTELYTKKVVKIRNNVNLTLLSIKQNLGVSESRNIAIKEIDNSSMIAILDADDEYYPNKLPILVNSILSAPFDIAAAYADYDIYDVTTKYTRREYKFSFDRKTLLYDNIVHSGSVVNMYHLSKIIDSNGIFDRNLRTCEDYDLWLRLSEVGYIVHIPESLSLVRVHQNNATNSVAKNTWINNRMTVLQKVKTRNG